MPALAALVFGLQLLCLAHVMRTGRPCQWLFIIVTLPLVGCLAYLFIEILPEVRHSRAARQAVRDIGALIDPERDLREKAERPPRPIPSRTARHWPTNACAAGAPPMPSVCCRAA